MVGRNRVYDDPAARARAYRLRKKKREEEVLGAAVQLQKALAGAKSAYIRTLSSDDLVDTLEKVSKYFSELG